MKDIVFDVMLGEYFVHTMRYKCAEGTELSEYRLREYVVKKLPTLRGKDFKIYIYESKR